MSSLRHHSEHPGENLESCGNADAQRLELEETPVQANPKAKIENLDELGFEVIILQIYREHQVPFPDGAQNQ